MVRGDPSRLLQVLSNLLDNALKFTHHGALTFTIEPVDGPSLSDCAHAVAFTIEDTGIGVREQDLDLVFESFRQVDGTTTRRYGGTGLGLAICKQLVELMDGSITLASTFGAGTTATVIVPLPSQVPPTSMSTNA
jgi:signal transduction histidine kinase